jgi:hypothetical protein
VAWLTWDSFTSAVLDIAKGLAGAGLAWLALRKRYSADTTDITEDKTKQWLITTLRAEIADARVQRDKATEVAKESVDIRIADATTIATLRADLKNHERSSVICEERSSKAEARAAAAEEHSRKQSEELLVANMYVETMIAVIARLDPAEAARLSAERRENKRKQAAEGPA